jgi:hypothetical protein
VNIFFHNYILEKKDCKNSKYIVTYKPIGKIYLKKCFLGGLLSKIAA